MAPLIETILRTRAGELGALFRQCRVQRVDLFGSAVSGAFDPERSDLDVLIRFEESYFPEIAASFLRLAEGLEQIFGRPVDLLTDRSIRNPYLRQGIEASRVRIYGD